MRQYSILICDDDPDIRFALKRTLKDFRVDEACEPEEALRLLKKGAYAALVSDFSLGAESDGLELLQQVKVLYPELVRVMVTGTRDLDVAIRAVNEGAVHRFFLKPWDEFKLVSALEMLLHSRHALVQTEAAEGTR
jgi:DNA-binding NtrC family response regulator